MAKVDLSPGEGRAVRLVPILERHRKELAPELSEKFVADVAEIEEQFQFDDLREEAKRRIRRALAIEVQERHLSESSSED
jgi:hypothetical protein